MELRAGDGALLRVLQDPQELRRSIGRVAAACAYRRLAELQTVRCLRDVREQTGLYVDDGGSRVRVELAGGWTLLLRPTDEPPPMDGDGRLDWALVNRVTILEFEQQTEVMASE